MTQALAEIQAVISDYFDALYHCDTELLQKVFHKKAVYATADETPLLHRTMAEYVPVVAARQSPASRGEPRRDVIDGIQLAGANTGFARVRCSIGQSDFVDFLTFVRDGGRWQIMSKVFQIIPRSEGAA
ncbi:nuclear transport factor 2 family protein [Roseibium denhamense]|uniref:Lumazine-binding n=1 Tax=Roseibium denhamense TaxID=76305 RepID=A0ABY1P6D9_9HYPH|nr:nuclear transport factor 2 family protein [Roseibium denhamense]MTI07747.1 nuclear transport factor 2 family protein [Roseibium denhamense]SMP25151.1 Putative lumazine-binding [Roseibium denhamense]